MVEQIFFFNFSKQNKGQTVLRWLFWTSINSEIINKKRLIDTTEGILPYAGEILPQVGS